ncbi:MAG: O-methyltransferase [Spirochaetales bacterium]
MAQEESVWTRVDEFAERHLLKHEDKLEWVLESNRQGGLPDYDVSPLQAQFLSVLTEAVGARRVLEIGTLGGYSTIFIARALGDGGSIITLELESKHAQVARANLERAGVSDKVDIRVGPAAETLDRMISDGERPFDLVFIDADKQNNPKYLEAALALSRKGTVIITDNVVRGGAVINESVHDESVVGTRAVYERASGIAKLKTTVLQTVGRKGHDGFAMSIVTKG